MKNKKERNYWLDNTKFLLIVLVVLGHFISSFRQYNMVNYTYSFIFIFHMPLFIFITGFFSKNIVTKNRNKILNYIVLYLIMQSIELIITKAKFTIVKPAYTLWYIQSIIIYNLLVPIIHKMKPISACILSFIIGLIIGFDNNANTIASLSRTFVMLPFFVMGYFMNEEMLNKIKSRRNIIFAVIFLILLAISIPYIIGKPIKMPRNLLLAQTSYSNMKLGKMGILYRTFWYVLATITSLSILLIVPKKKLPIISKFGTRTLQVYCLHSIICLLLKNTELYAKIDTRLELICLGISAIIVTTILSFKMFSYPFDFIMSRKFKIINKEIDESKA